MNVSFHDLETYSEVPIKNGTHAYFQGAEVLLWAYALNDGPVKVWDVASGAPMPAALKACLDDPENLTVWHNGGMFDRQGLRYVLGIDLPIERVHDTLVRALAHSLPGSLGKLCEIMGVPLDQAKDRDGRRFIQLFCKPLPKNHKLKRATAKTHPVEWARFVDYARLDVEAMRVLYKKLPTWNYQGRELELWRLDQRINQRGFCVDLDLADAALAAVTAEQKRLKARTADLTRGEVQAASQRDQMLAHILSEYGVDLPDMKGSTLETRMQDPNLPAGLRELLAVRLQTSTTSTAKYQTFKRWASPDGRLRGTLQFCGASRTGRWAGRGPQLQNLPRPDMEQEEIDQAVEAFKLGCADLVLPDVMRAASNAIRGMIVATPGKKLVVSDLEQIEARVAPWLAGEAWKLEAFAEYDAGRGFDNYVLAYARAFGVDPASVTKKQRQIGKVMELALSYQGSVGAFVTFALVYGIDLEAMAADALPTLPAAAIKSAEGMLAWRRQKNMTTYGLSDRVFIVCEVFKSLWRDAHPEITSYWPELEKAAMRACANPGQTIPCRAVSFRRVGAWLRMILPSGRSLCYPAPVVEDGKLAYSGINQYTRQWGKVHTYGGKFFEQLCQSTAREVMGHNMPAIEAAGFDILISVHDELICEALDLPHLTSDKLSTLLATVPPWMQGCPLAAGGFEAHRYRKE